MKESQNCIEFQKLFQCINEPVISFAWDSTGFRTEEFVKQVIERGVEIWEGQIKVLLSLSVSPIRSSFREAKGSAHPLCIGGRCFDIVIEWHEEAEKLELTILIPFPNCK